MLFVGGAFCPLFLPLCFLRYSRLTRLSHALRNFQHYVYVSLNLRSRGEASGSGPDAIKTDGKR